MKILIAIDSLKGSLTSLEAANAIKDGILLAGESAEITISPLADGGEGTVEALASGLGGTLRTTSVMGPLGKDVGCVYGTVGDLAIIEMASASGITLVERDERDPMRATTYGTGQAIKDAITRGCRRFIVGIGGSATNDGGAGMLQALGYEFLDECGNPIPLGAEGLAKLESIKCDKIIPELSECEFRIACDVDNPLCGKRGASAVYGPQKGATPDMAERLDSLLYRYSEIVMRDFPRADRDHPGAGAAGGLGFAFLSFLNATLESGIDIVLEETGLKDKVEAADLVITGEGRLDAQTVMGKAPIGVARLAKSAGKPVIAFSGCVSDDARVLNENGIDAFFPILRSVSTLDEALDKKNAYLNMRSTAEQVFRLINKGRSLWQV